MSRPNAMGFLSGLLLLVFAREAFVGAQLSAPVSQDEHVNVDGNKFLQNHATLDGASLREEELTFDVCPQNIELRWSTEVSSSIYATPLITDLYSDGRKDIIVPSFVHYLEALEADNGAQAVGWPAFHRSTTHASPLLYDIDTDGVQDVLLATYNGEVMFFKDTGEQLPLGLTLPRLRVKKFWFKGLNDDPNIRDPKGLGGEEAAQISFADTLAKRAAAAAASGYKTPTNASSPRPATEQVIKQLKEYRKKMVEYRDKYSDAALKQLLSETHAVNPTFYGLLMNQLREEGLLDKDGRVRLPKSSPPPAQATSSPPSRVTMGAGGTGTQRRRLMHVTRDRSGTDEGSRATERGGTAFPLPSGTSRSNFTRAPMIDPEDTGDDSGGPGRKLLKEGDGGLSGGGRRKLMQVTRDRSGTDEGNRARERGWVAFQLPSGSFRNNFVRAPMIDPADTGPADTGMDSGDDSGGDPGRKLLKEGDGGLSGGGKRKLMQADGGVPDATVAGVEEGPGGKLTQEAAESFQVFQDKDMEEGGEGEDRTGGEEVMEGDGEIEEEDDTEEPQTDLALGQDELDTVARENQERVAQQEAGAGGGGLGDGEDFDPYYHSILDKDEKKELGEKAEYDELGERYEREEVGDEEEDGDGFLPGESDEKRAERLAELNALTLGIDTSSMDEGDGVTADRDHYEHLYGGDYEALAAARDKTLGHWWQDEEFKQNKHQADEQYIYVDAHVLTTPNIADIDGDGHDELVMAVSYFYDKEYYDQPAHRHELGDDLDMAKYIASGVVVWDLRTRTVKWSQHLDLSTDTTTFKAYAYGAPTLADVNKDGQLEVVLGTSMGFLYVLDAIKGEPLPGWPIQMGEVQGQALVMDINNDGAIEIVAGDTRGNVAAFRASGEELWSRHVKSLVAQGAVAGDINNDGELEVVFGTSSGHIYALAGTTGADVKNFPFRTHGRVHAPALITRLKDGPSQHIIVTSFDGYLYLVDGISGCADTVDIGETSYSMVLADDLDGNGKMDLLVSTMNGNVYCFETPSNYHPLKTWTSQIMGPNGMVARHDLVGIYATPDSRRPRDVAGEKLSIQVQVLDKRSVFAPNGTLITHKGGPYNISAVLRGVGVKEMASGSLPVIGVADTVQSPGLYTLEIPCPRTRASATIHLEMTDGHGLTLSDDFALSFHMHFHKLLKWLVAAPLALMVVGLMAMVGSRDEEEAISLPTTMHQA